MQAELRRQQYTLSICGGVVILFSLWSIVKTLAISYLEKPRVVNAAIEVSKQDMVIASLAVILELIIVAIPVITRVYVGLCARAEARGKERGTLYLALAFAMLVLEISGFILSLFFYGESQPLVRTFANACVDASSAYALYELVRSGILVKRIAHELDASGR